MSWSWKLGSLFGIPIFIHWTFLILLAWLVFGHWTQGHDALQTAEGVGFVLSIFGCVVLHELGHALMARRFGVGTSDITLLPIGGVARLERIPEKPIQEFLVAIAGPAVNLAIILLLLIAGVRPLIQGSEVDMLIRQGFWSKLLVVNGFLVAFNVLPAFPMDGGRILRALLAMKLPYPTATQIAATIGKMMAIVFVFAGLSIGNPFLMLIALFVWFGAEAESRQVQERFLLRGIPVEKAMMTEFHTITPDTSLGEVAELLLAGTQQDFPVLDNGQPDALLTRASLAQGLHEGGRSLRVAEAPLVPLGRVDAVEPLAPTVGRLREAGQSCVLVTRLGRLEGLLTLDNVGELLMVRSALAEAAD